MEFVYIHVLLRFRLFLELLYYWDDIRPYEFLALFYVGLILYSLYFVTQQVSYIKAIDWWMSLCIGTVEKLVFERVKMKFLRYETCKILHIFHDTFWNFESFLTGEEIDKSASSG